MDCRCPPWEPVVAVVFDESTRPKCPQSPHPLPTQQCSHRNALKLGGRPDPGRGECPPGCSGQWTCGSGSQWLEHARSAVSWRWPGSAPHEAAAGWRSAPHRPRAERPPPRSRDPHLGGTEMLGRCAAGPPDRQRPPRAHPARRPLLWAAWTRRRRHYLQERWQLRGWHIPDRTTRPRAPPGEGGPNTPCGTYRSAGPIRPRPAAPQTTAWPEVLRCLPARQGPGPPLLSSVRNAGCGRASRRAPRSPSITAIAEQQAVLPVAAATHLTKGGVVLLLSGPGILHGDLEAEGAAAHMASGADPSTQQG